MAHCLSNRDNATWGLTKLEANAAGRVSPITTGSSLSFKALKALSPLYSGGLFIAGLLIFSPIIEGGTTHLPILLIRLALLCFLIDWTFRLMQPQGTVLRKNRLLPLTFVFVGYAGLTIGWSPYKNASIQSLVTLLMYAGFFFVVLQEVKFPRDARRLVLVLAGVGAVEGGVGLAQYLVLGETRARGTFFNPNFFATYEACIAALVTGVLGFTSCKDLSRWERAILWVALVVSLGGFVVAQSRGATLALGVAITFVGINRFGTRVVAILVCCLLAGVLIPNPLKQRFINVSVQDPYAYTRVDIWENSLERIADRPMGFGLGMYKYTSFQHRFPVSRDIARYGKRAETAHNEYLQMAVELGIMGVGIFLIGFIMWSVEIRHVLKGKLAPLDRGLVVGLSGATLGILAHGMVDSVFHQPGLMMLFIVVGGIALSFRHFSLSGMAWQRNVSLPYSLSCLALIVVFAIASLILIIQPAAGWYAHERAERALREAKTDEALTWLHRASIMDPGTTAYHDATARVAAQQYEISRDPRWLIEAIEEERTAMVLNPSDGRFPHRLGRLYASLSARSTRHEERQQWLSQASECQEQAIRLDPYSPQSYFELAKLRIDQSRDQDARDLLDRALLLEPHFLPARALLGEQLLKLGKPVEARAEYQRILDTIRSYEGKTLSLEEQEYLNVDMYPIARALTLMEMR